MQKKLYDAIEEYNNMACDNLTYINTVNEQKVLNRRDEVEAYYESMMEWFIKLQERRESVEKGVELLRLAKPDCPQKLKLIETLDSDIEHLESLVVYEWSDVGDTSDDMEQD